MDIIGGMPDPDDILQWIIDELNILVMITCMTPLKKVIGGSVEVFELRVSFESIGTPSDKENRYWVGRLRVNDPEYKFENRHFYFDTVTEQSFILEKGSNQIPINLKG